MERIGDYELIAVTGSGASGQVWRARRRGGLGQIVAIKRMGAHASSEQRTQLRAEAAVLHDLDHPHIVQILDIVDDGDGVAIVMAFAPGGTLADLLAERGALEPGAVVALVGPLADALASAHRREVVHGDVKPANVLFTSDGEPLLADFGTNRVEVSGVAEVTPEYAAPEVLAGRPAAAAADVYSLGAVAVELLTGAVPAAGRLDGATEEAAALADILRASLAPDPVDRPTAAQLSAELRGAVAAADQQLPGPARARGAAAPATRSFGPRPERASDSSTVRRRLPWALGAAALLGVGSLFALTRGDDAEGCPEVTVDPIAGSQAAAGDFDGDGCPSPAAFTDSGPGGRGILRVDLGSGAPFEVSIGGPDDVLFVGDWDCDGVDRPALYRPADGTVVYVEELEVGATAAAVPLAAADEEVRVRTDDEGCDELVPR